MAKPTAKLKLVAALYGLMALTQVAVAAIFLGFEDWNIGFLIQDIDAVGGLPLYLAVVFAINAALAIGAWRFNGMSRRTQVLELTVAVAVPVLVAADVVWDVYLWLGRDAFADVDRETLISGLGGRSLLVVGYACLAVWLLRAFRAPADG